jgi:hypothetical protein
VLHNPVASKDAAVRVNSFAFNFIKRFPKVLIEGIIDSIRMIDEELWRQSRQSRQIHELPPDGVMIQQMTV